MTTGKNLLEEFYNLKVSQLMDKRTWDLPLIEEKEDIYHVLSIVSAKNHIWVVKNKENKELVGVITEHDVLSILAPKDFPSYVFGMPDIRSLQYGTTRSAEDVMANKVITCEPDEKIVDALMKMVKYRLRRLPVCKDKKIVGELTLHQLIRKYYSATQYHPILDEEEGG